jgi:hypothetical protein
MSSDSFNMLKAAAIGAAVGIGAAFVGAVRDSIDTTMAYNKEIRDLAQNLGITTEETSRLIQTADDFTVSQETVTTALQMAVKRGFAPNIETIAMMADEYVALESPTRRAARMSEVFGRNWSALVPLLKEGGQAIRDVAAAQSDALIVTEEQSKATRELEKSMDDLGDKALALKLKVGNALVPALTDAADTGSKFVDIVTNAEAPIERMNRQLEYAITFLGKEHPLVRQVRDEIEKYGEELGRIKQQEDLRNRLLAEGRVELGKTAEAYAGTSAGMLEYAEAAREGGDASKVWSGFVKEGADAAKTAAAEYDKLAAATANMLTSYLEATEGFKEVEPINIARAALERLSKLMEEDPENIERYQKQFEELQLTYGLITPAAQAAQVSANQLTSALIAGVIGPDEYKMAVERLQVAAKDGTVDITELGLSALTASKYFSFITPPVSEAAKKLIELKRDADGATDALNKIPTDIKIKVSYDIGKVPQFALPPMQGPPAPSPKPATPTVKPPKPPVRPPKPGLARGGPALPQQSYTVGENGPELLQMFGSGGHVTPLAGGSKGLTIVNYITAAPGMNIDALAARVSQKIARNLRSAVASGAGYTGG